MVLLHADPVCSEPKLFIGGLRFDISRDEVVNHFQQFGPLKSCVLLTHKDSGKPKGCAMVLYHKWAHAETAVEQNNGAASDMSNPRPLIVKFADPQRRPEDGMLVGVTPKKLFIGQIPRAISQEQIRSICGPYGEIVDLNIMQPKRDNAMGCAFVTYATWAAAEAASEALNGTFTFPGAAQPIMVKLADAKAQDMQRVGAKRGMDMMGGGPAKRQMMGGGMGRNMGMMGGMGMMPGMGNMGMGMNPMMMNMMGQGMPGMMGQGMGMGMMNQGMMGGMMGQGQGGMMGQAGAGGQAGGANQNWQQGQAGGAGPMGQAGGMMGDQAGQQGAAGGQDAAGGMGGGMAGGMGGGMSGAMGNFSQGMNMNMPMGYGMGNMGMAGMGMGGPMGGMNAMGGGMGGMGGGRKQAGLMGLGDQNGNLQAAKAWKLFIGQISFDMAEGDLFPFFSQFGTILELVLLRGQGDGRHKGCGFLIYSSAEEAEAALAANGATLPNDARQRQIMVKYANAKGN